MQVMVDHKPLDVTIAPGAVLGQLVEQIRTHVAERKRVVENMIVDGEAAPAGQLEQWLARPCDPIGRVEFQTACPRAMARDALAAVGTLIGDSTQLHQGAAEKLSAGQAGKAMEMLLGCLNFYKTAQEAVSQVIQLHRLNLESMKIGEQSAAEAVAGLMRQLSEVKGALEARDFVLLADQLNYEFPRITERWQAILGELSRTLQ